MERADYSPAQSVHLGTRTEYDVTGMTMFKLILQAHSHSCWLTNDDPNATAT